MHSFRSFRVAAVLPLQAAEERVGGEAFRIVGHCFFPAPAQIAQTLLPSLYLCVQSCRASRTTSLCEKYCPY